MLSGELHFEPFLDAFLSLTAALLACLAETAGDTTTATALSELQVSPPCPPAMHRLCIVVAFSRLRCLVAFVSLAIACSGPPYWFHLII